LEILEWDGELSGEWHSHPEDEPQPSTLDLGNWQQIGSKAVLEQDFMLFLITGRTAARVWELRRAEMTITHLELTT